MRICRFQTADGRTLFGQALDERTARVIEGSPLAEFHVTDRVEPIARLLPPIEPPNIFAIGLNYRRHAEETGAALPSQPLIFIKATTTLIGPGDPIVLPAVAPDEVDYEAEIAIVIGRRTRHVSTEQAFDHVLGFTCANDVSARDCQKRIDKQWARGKSFDSFCPLGPWIVTPDEIDPDRSAIRSRLNGRVMQDSSTSDMIFSCRQLVSYLSQQFTLLPGTLILTGTPEGVGTARQPPVYLRPGDTIEVEIDGIGTLRNGVVAESAG